MDDAILNYRLDVVFFAFFSLGGMAWLHRWLRRTGRGFRMSVASWTLLLTLIGFGVYFAESAGMAERHSLRKMLEGFAPTYAHELQRMGHEHIGLATPADDPLYLSLIDTEIQWLKINPQVNDIYTFKMKSDGTVVLLVDSETDYDRNGRYEGDRESRTAIGEVYPEADVNLKRTFQGAPSFDGIPYTDRWGTWVSAYVPILDTQGRVDAVLGVDYAASEWIAAILKRRLAMLGYAAIIVIIYIASLAIVTLSRREKQALHQSVERFQLLSKATNDTTWDWDVTTGVVSWGDGIRSVYGYTAEQAGPSLEWWSNKIHPEDKEGIVRSVEEVIEGSLSVWSGEYRFERADGGYVHVYDRGYLMRDTQGKPVRMIGAMMDMTEIRRTQEMLSKATSENLLLAQVVESASDGIVITDPNQPDNPTIYANEAFAKMTGYTVPEILGKNCRFLQGPETDPAAVEAIREAVREKRVFKISLLNYRKDGTTFWNGLRISPIFSPNGALQYFLGFQADVSQRMKAEMQLMAERDYTSSIIQGTPAVICGVASNGQINFINPAGERATGYKADELIGKIGWSVFYPGEEYKQVESLFRDFKKGPARDREIVLTAKTGEKRAISWNTLNRLGPMGELVEIVWFGYDITDRKKLEAQLQQSQKMETVGTLAGGIAHDLNNQLTPLSGYIDFVLNDTPAQDPRREFLMEAEQAARRCTEVVQRLMSVSRTSNQKKTWLRLDDFLAEVNRFFSKILPATIQTEVICDSSVWPVMANDTELQTVLLNLAVNARDAMPDGGKLIIQARNILLDENKVSLGFKPGNYVLISVMDTGKGIPPDILGKVFEPFFTTKPKGLGTGLGLSMVFCVIKDHGGWVEAQSEVGRGTVMQVFLPANPGAEAAPCLDNAVSQKMPVGNETILFADDEEPIRNLGRLFLERLGYQVILAEDGARAVELYKDRHEQIAAVILDMTMPKLTGRQVLKKILEIDAKAKVILASGFTAEGTAKELIAEGAVDFLSKPYTIFPLSQMLRKVIDR